MVIVLKDVKGNRRLKTTDSSTTLPYLIYVRSGATPMSLEHCRLKKNGAQAYKLQSVGAGEAVYESDALTAKQLRRR